MTINNVFENIKKMNKHGQEFWSARDLWKILGYTEYGKFLPAISRAMKACKNSKQAISDHFAEVSDMVKIGSGAERKIDDYNLSRYACYLIVQNGDPRKEEIALAQTYFAIQTRKQEVQEALLEDQKRVMLRGEATEHNKKLFQTAQQAGVRNYGEFQDYGYMGLYGGMRNTDIHKSKGLTKSQKILDHMNSEELGANLFRTTQTEAKIKREGIQGQKKASETHYEVGTTVRKTIQELGGTMPEDLPKIDGINKAKTRLKKADRKSLESKNKKK